MKIPQEFMGQRFSIGMPTPLIEVNGATLPTNLIMSSLVAYDWTGNFREL
ncbi:hypothetical protein [Dyadobacter soli]|nr:hypothetical protein [Dyadobacter soli]